MRLAADLDALVQSCSGPWLITGVAGFIGSNLLQCLLERDQPVRGLDNFATGHARNLDQVRAAVRPDQWARFEFLQGDIRQASICHQACQGMRRVLHQAALGSVPGSMADPVGAHATNVTGTLHLFRAAQEASVARVVYASSCAVYGNTTRLPIAEDQADLPLSPYAGTKLMDELYAGLFARCYGLSIVGLRYFNVFGPRQDPEGAYAAVIPRWTTAFLKGDPVTIYGDGETSRDFCFVGDVVQANLRAALLENLERQAPVYNVGLGEQTSLNQLFVLLRDQLAIALPGIAGWQPRYEPFRAGDVRHSRSDLTAVRRGLGYEPYYPFAQGLAESLAWYREHLA